MWERERERIGLQANFSSKLRSGTVSGLELGESYMAHAESSNQHGRSVSSNNVSFSLAAQEKDKPREPHSLRVAAAWPDRVNLTWDWNQLLVDSGKRVKSYKFRVYFKTELEQAQKKVPAQ